MATSGGSVPSSSLFSLLPTNRLLYHQNGLAATDLIAASATGTFPTAANDTTNVLTQLSLPLTSVADSRRRLLEDLHALKMNASSLSMYNQSYASLFSHPASLTTGINNKTDVAALLGHHKEATAMFTTPRLNSD